MRRCDDWDVPDEDHINKMNRRKKVRPKPPKDPLEEIWEYFLPLMQLYDARHSFVKKLKKRLRKKKRRR
jgi:hypothetical protein